jgi:hypothetical protein
MKRLVRIAMVLTAVWPLDAAAVDGVGLFAFLPALEWLFWFLLIVAAVKVVNRGAFPNGPAPSPVRRVIFGALGALLLSPMLVAVLSPHYVRALCATASLQIGVQPSGWSPPSRGTKATFSSRLVEQGEIETNTIPGLLDFYGREGAWLDAWKYKYRLVDQTTGQTLLSASYFGSRRTGPMACAAAASYWSLHREFEKKAFAGAHE